MFVLKVVLVLVCLGIFVVADPVPDTSEKCVSCQTHVSELNSVWSNATTYVKQQKKTLFYFYSFLMIGCVTSNFCSGID